MLKGDVVSMLRFVFVVSLFVLGFFQSVSFAQPGATNPPTLEELKKQLEEAKKRDEEYKTNLKTVQDNAAAYQQQISDAQYSITRGLQQKDVSMVNDGLSRLSALAGSKGTAMLSAINVIPILAVDARGEATALEYKVKLEEMKVKSNLTLDERITTIKIENENKIKEMQKWQDEAKQQYNQSQTALFAQQQSYRKLKIISFITIPFNFLCFLIVSLLYRKKSVQFKKNSTDLQSFKQKQEELAKQLEQEAITKQELEQQKQEIENKILEIQQQTDMEMSKEKNLLLQTQKQQQQLEFEKVKLAQAEAENQKQLELEKMQRQTQLEQEQEKTKALQLEKQKAEVERQNTLKSYPPLEHIEVFTNGFDELQQWIVKGDEENQVFKLYTKLKEVLEKNSKIPIEKKRMMSNDVIRLNQIETLMDLYGEKIARVQQDETINEDERQIKMNYWVSLRDKEIQDLQAR